MVLPMRPVVVSWPANDRENRIEAISSRVSRSGASRWIAIRSLARSSAGAAGLGVHQVAQVLAVRGHAGGDLHLVLRRGPAQASAARYPHHRLSWAKSPAGTPIRENTMFGGSGKASAPTRSNSSLPSTASRSRTVVALDGGDHRGDPVHAERAGGRPAEPGVFGLIQADHARLGLVPARQQDLLGLRG